MSEKNRFSTLLEQLMQTADLKNYVLAQELQYDVSYISKWISGKMLPAEKGSSRILRKISHAIVTSLNTASRQEMYDDYRVSSDDDLENAVYDHLAAEYDYVKGLKKSIGLDIAPKASFFPELTLPQYVSKMRHPVLRRVKSLDIVSAMDILSMEHEYRLAIAGIQNQHVMNEGDYPNVHLSMIINLDTDQKDYVYDSIFIINMLTSFANVDFQLYGGRQAYGKAMFVVKNSFAISGMLLDQGHCMSVTTTEDPDICNKLYNDVKLMFTREALIFRKVTMAEILKDFRYIQSILTTHPRWLLGHITEHFVPPELFEDILSHALSEEDFGADRQELIKIHGLTKGILEESSVQIMFYESALNDFAVTGELDFFNRKVYLDFEQRQKVIRHILALIKGNPHMKIKLVRGRFVPDFQYIAHPCLFLSDGFDYLRLIRNNKEENIVSFNSAEIRSIFDRFYAEIWEYHKEIVISDINTLTAAFMHILDTIQFISRRK